MNMRELARLTGVSVSTVSKAFNHAPDISDATKQYILETAKQHGCFEKYTKNKYSKKVIAIICPELRSYHYADSVDRLQKLIERDNGIVLISTDDFDGKKQLQLIDYYATFLQVDGIFVYRHDNHPLKEYDTPIISLSSCDSNTINTVYCSLEEPIQQAITHLHKLKHSRIGFLGERLTHGKQQEYLNAMKSLQLEVPENYIITSDFRFEKAGEDGMEQLLRLPTPPTAVLCAYDNIACGAISYLTRNGYNVPTDFSVIGMDNTSSGQHMSPALSTIDSGYDEINLIAWDLMKKKLNDKHYHLHQKIIISGRFILRETTDIAKE